MTPVSIAVEGPTDAAVVERILSNAGCSIAAVYGQSGKPTTREIAGYNRAAQFSPWLVLRDLDSDAACAAELVSATLTNPARWMRLRIAVMEMEAWLLADSETLAGFLRVRQALIPGDPESLPDPKLTLVNLARKSRSKAIRDDMVPVAGTSGVVGPLYTSRVAEYARGHWRPHIAARRSDSLRRCIQRVGELAGYIVNGVVAQ